MKTVKIPVRIVDGKAEYFYGGAFPDIRDGTGDLVIPAFSVLDRSFLEECSLNDKSKILPKGALLMINVRPDTTARGLRQDIKCGPLAGNVEVQLLEPLYLWHRGTKSSVLEPCKCFIPALKTNASSLNHAYTIISKQFETKRQTNTGNVFKKAYFMDGQKWETLQKLRERYDAQFERRFSASHRQGNAVLTFADSIVIDQSVLWEDYEGRMIASISIDGLTIEDNDENNQNESKQAVTTSALQSVLFELIRERFVTVAEFDNWLAKNGINADRRAGLPTVTPDAFDDLFKLLDEFFAGKMGQGYLTDGRNVSFDPEELLCGHLADQERVVIVDEDSYKLLDEILASGWIRVGSYFKRLPVYPCKPESRRNIPVRIRLKDFSFSKNQRRVLRKNSDVKVEIAPPFITKEEEEMFDRHKSRFDETPPKSIHDIIPPSSLTQIKKVTVREDDRLIAVSYLDIGKTSAFSIYGMFEPSIKWRSLGIFSILKEIEFSIYEGKQFYYLGFVHEGPSHYDYKKNFRGLEYFDWNGNWITATTLRQSRGLRFQQLQRLQEHN